MALKIFQLLSLPLSILAALLPALAAVSLIRGHHSERDNARLWPALLLIVAFSVLTLRLWANFPPINQYDDDDYMAHAAAITFMDFPDYGREHLPAAGRSLPIGAPGAAIMASPFVALGALADRLEGNPIAERRLEDNRFGSHSHFAFVASTIFYFSLAVFLWAGLLRRFGDPGSVFMAMLAGIFLVGLPIMVWRRPVFSHTYEFFLQSLWVAWLCRAAESRRSGWSGERPSFVTLGVVAALTFLTRFNNVFFALIWPALIVAAATGGFRLRRAGAFFKPYLPFLLVAAWYLALPHFFNPPNQPGSSSAGYEATVSRALSQLHGPLVYLKRIWHILTGPDMGLIFTAPALILGFWATLTRTPSELRPYMPLLFLASLPPCFMVLTWGSFGSSYGYRYVVFSLAPLILIPLTALLDDWRKEGRSIFLTLFCAWLLLPFLAQTFFQSILKWDAMPNWFSADGALTMGRENFVGDIFDCLVQTPLEFFGALVKIPAQTLSFCRANLAQGDYLTEGRYLLLFLEPPLLWMALRMGMRR